jgi:hypothetical protein
MIRAASDLAGAEKTGLHPLIMSSPAVVDVEIALGRAQESEASESTADDTASSAKRNLDRLDVATLERQGTDIAVVFHEAKHFTNAALRARSGSPAVVDQLRRYRSTLKHHTPALIARYQAACRAILRLNAMRRHVRAETGAGVPFPPDPMVQEVATGNAVLTIDPDPRLIVFGFDADQKKGQLQIILSALKTADPNLAVYAAGDPSSAGGAFRPPAKQHLRQ